jgi:SAM-dependent methyltransferase
MPLASERFPRSSRYDPDWIVAGASGGANPLWLTEWLTEAMPLRAGTRVLDLGCGRGLSSIFLHEEFGVQVWSTDLWFSVDERARRIHDAGLADAVFPIHADARALPFAAGFFDASTTAPTTSTSATSPASSAREDSSGSRARAWSRRSTARFPITSRRGGNPA